MEEKNFCYECKYFYIKDVGGGYSECGCKVDGDNTFGTCSKYEDNIDWAVWVHAGETNKNIDYDSLEDVSDFEGMFDDIED